MTVQDNSIDSTSNSAGTCSHGRPFHLHCSQCNVDAEPDEPAYPQGSSAFIKLGDQAKFEGEVKSGLTKRELFAAMAMQGLRAADANATSYTESSTLAKLAVQDADALLKELAK